MVYYEKTKRPASVIGLDETSPLEKPMRLRPDPSPRVRSRRSPLSLLSAVPEFALFLFLVSFPLMSPPEDWEWLNVAAARHVVSQGVPFVLDREDPLLIHPPTTAHLVALASLLPFEGTWPLKVPGVICICLTGLLLWSLALALYGDRLVAHAALLFYFSNPLVVQGATSLDFADGTLLPLALTAFALLFVRREPDLHRKAIVLLGLCLGAALLCKYTTPLALIAGVFLVTLLHQGVARSFRITAGLVLCGNTLFFALYGAYCAWLTGRPGIETEFAALVLRPFQYLLRGDATLYFWELAPRQLLTTATRTVLYCGPFLVLSFAWAAAGVVRRGISRQGSRQAEDLVAFLGSSIFFGYLAIVGATSSFPKYEAPALPFISLLAASAIVPRTRTLDRRMMCAIAVWAVVLLAYYGLSVGDLIYVLNYQLKRSLIYGGAEEVMVRFAGMAVLYVAPLAVLLVLRRLGLSRERFQLALVVLVFSSQSAQTFVTGASGYLTKYYYGEPARDYERIIEKINTFGEDDLILSRGIVAPASERGPRAVSLTNEDWRDPSAVRAHLEQRAPEAFIFGPSMNTVEQMRDSLESPELRSYLEKNYVQEGSGDFFLYVPR